METRCPMGAIFPEERVGGHWQAVGYGRFPAGTWVSELLLSGLQWKPVQLLLYQFSQHLQLSVVKQWFALPELHLLWILAQLSRISV